MHQENESGHKTHSFRRARNAKERCSQGEAFKPVDNCRAHGDGATHAMKYLHKCHQVKQVHTCCGLWDPSGGARTGKQRSATAVYTTT